MTDNTLDTVKVVWLICAVIGFIVSSIAIFHRTQDLRFIKARAGLSMREARLITARQMWKDEAAFLMIQVILVIIRYGALTGPEPWSSDFRRFWATDGTIVAAGGIAIALTRVWNLMDRYAVIKEIRRA